MSQRWSRRRQARWIRGLTNALAALGVLSAGPTPAAAVELYEGEKFSARLDTTLSVGAAFRAQDRDENLFFLGNDNDDPSSGAKNGDVFFTTADDGNLNYDKGNGYSVAVKGTFELELDYRADWRALKTLGGFFRATAFYDFLGNCAGCTRRTDLASGARLRGSVLDGGVVGAQWLFLDMYLNAQFDAWDRFLDVRIGNQVLSWGESVFIPFGINSINAFDVAKLRTPGSELKEALVPAPIIRISSDIGGGLGIEGFYQFQWNRTNVDPTGSYFATNDLVGRASPGLFTGNPFSQTLNGNDQGSDANSIPGVCGAQAPPAMDLARCTAQQLFSAGAGVPKLSDQLPSEQGQGGVALRYFWDRILTEFGLYYLHFHSKTPAVGFQALALDPFSNPLTGFFRQYAEDTNLVGASFATEILNSALSGEISYRPNDPTPLSASGLATLKANANPLETVYQDGFVEEERLQAQVNLISTLGPSTRWGVGPAIRWLRADSIAFITEIGVAYYPDLAPQCATPIFLDPSQQFLFPDYPTNKPDCVPYAGPGPSDSPGAILSLQPGFVLPRRSKVNATSSGYQILIQGTYTNPLGVPITLTPSVGWLHDFYGTTPNLAFIEGRKAVTLGLEVDYLQTYGANITYANFFGAKNRNLVKDRDFVSFSFTYSF